MSTAPKHRWSFSLRTLFLAVILASICCWLGLNYQQVRLRAYLYKRAINNTAGVREPARSTKLPTIWRLMGARQVDGFLLETDASDTDMTQLQAAFPEAVVRRAGEGTPPIYFFEQFPEFGRDGGSTD
jgi:hypothetical protein